jgi:hypothetical protein
VHLSAVPAQAGARRQESSPQGTGPTKKSAKERKKIWKKKNQIIKTNYLTKAMLLSPTTS